MTFFKSDSSKATTGFTTIPAGKYEMFIEAGAKKQTGAGAPMINFALIMREDVPGQEQYKGRKFWTNLVFQENTEGIVQGFLKAIGAPDGKEFPTIEAFIDYSVGKAVLADVKIGEYKGEERNEIGFMNASKVGGGKVDDPFETVNVADPLDNGGNYTRVEEDPFANSSGPIEVSDDDLPF